MKDQEAIENCYEKMYQGMLDKDRELLSEVLHDSFVLIHMTGMHQPKEEFISAVVDGTLNYYTASHQRMDVDIAGDNAVLVGKTLVNAAVFGGREHTWRLQQDLKLVKENGTWKITEARASTY